MQNQENLRLRWLPQSSKCPSKEVAVTRGVRYSERCKSYGVKNKTTRYNYEQIKNKGDLFENVNLKLSLLNEYCE